MTRDRNRFAAKGAGMTECYKWSDVGRRAAWQSLPPGRCYFAVHRASNQRYVTYTVTQAQRPVTYVAGNIYASLLLLINLRARACVRDCKEKLFTNRTVESVQ